LSPKHNAYHRTHRILCRSNHFQVLMEKKAHRRTSIPTWADRSLSEWRRIDWLRGSRALEQRSKLRRNRSRFWSLLQNYVQAQVTQSTETLELARSLQNWLKACFLSQFEIPQNPARQFLLCAFSSTSNRIADLRKCDQLEMNNNCSRVRTFPTQVAWPPEFSSQPLHIFDKPGFTFVYPCKSWWFLAASFCFSSNLTHISTWKQFLKIVSSYSMICLRILPVSTM